MTNKRKSIWADHWTWKRLRQGFQNRWLYFVLWQSLQHGAPWETSQLNVSQLAEICRTASEPEFAQHWTHTYWAGEIQKWLLVLFLLPMRKLQPGHLVTAFGLVLGKSNNKPHSKASHDSCASLHDSSIDSSPIESYTSNPVAERELHSFDQQTTSNASNPPEAFISQLSPRHCTTVPAWRFQHTAWCFHTNTNKPLFPSS